MRLLAALWQRLTTDLFLTGLLVLFAGLVIVLPIHWQGLPGLVEWHTLGILAGLMVLSRGLEDSGALARAGRWLLTRMHTQRQLAVALVLFAAMLSALITNDVALFIVVPLTLSLGLVARLPLGRLVIFEALAVNAGSAVSPIGNPQNLYLWQLSGESFLTFFWAMTPISLWMMALLLVFTLCAFPARAVDLHEGQAVRRALDPLLLRLSLLCYPVFLLLVEMGYTLAGLVLVLALFTLLRRQVLRGVDWLILVIFILMFVNLGLIAQLPLMAALADNLLALPGGEITGGALLSQVISNVPAAIFLAAFSEHWALLAWGVNVGGFGLAIGSLANLIALRLGRQRGLWLAFHVWSLPMLLLSLLGAWLLQLWWG
ncbi:MAG: transporter [Marinobacter sp.]|nr:transporter [Marinobacter sp.]